VRLTLADPPEMVAISEEHLEIALENLLDNATRHSPGSIVEVTLGSDAGRLEIVVRDHGTGISPGNQRRIYERFFTTERDRGGTGLGLSIVLAIAKARHGSIDFTTSESGTSFRLVL